MENQTQNSNQKQKLGAVWVRTSAKTNSKFLSIKFNLASYGINKEVDLIAFLNKSKGAGDKRPDFEIFASEPRPTNYTPAPKQTVPVVAAPVDNQIL